MDGFNRRQNTTEERVIELKDRSQDIAHNFAWKNKLYEKSGKEIQGIK